MKKLHIFGVVMFAVFTFSAISAVSAFAEAELLLEGTAITTATAASVEGELLLTDLTSVGELALACSSILDGTIQPGGKDFLIEDMLVLGGTGEIGNNLDGEALSCVGFLELCEESVLASLWTQNLPWLIEFELMTVGTENKYLFRLGEDTEIKTGLPAVEFDCTTIIGLVEDLCEGRYTGFLDTEPMDLLELFSLKEQEEDGEEGTCTLTKEKTYHIEGAALIFVSGKTLTISG